MPNTGPEAKAAEEIASSERLWPENRFHEMERIILRANAAHYLPLLRGLFGALSGMTNHFMSITGYSPIVVNEQIELVKKEISRLEGAEK